MRNIEQGVKRVLLFSPFQAIPEHAFIEKHVAEILKFSGRFEYDVITCDGTLVNSCTAMSAHRLRFSSPIEKKHEICRICRQYRDDTYGIGFRGTKYGLETELSESMQSVIRAERPKIQKELFEYDFDGLRLGRLSSYELMLAHKLGALNDLPPELSAELCVSIENNLSVALVVQAVLAKKSYDAVMVYNGNYGANHTAHAVARQRFPNIQTVSIHYGLNWETQMDSLFLVNGFHQEHLRDRTRYFLSNRSAIDTSHLDAGEIDRYIAFLHAARSPWIYSAPKTGELATIFEKLNLDPSKPTALLATGSKDEIFGLEFAVFHSTPLNWFEWTFRDQAEWIEQTVDFFRSHPEWQLIIRIHPREFPNKREGVRSLAANVYESLAERLPKNIAINLPDDSISIYDLYDSVSIMLSSWSTVGLESALAGVPTASITRGISLYPNEWVHFYSSDPSAYFENIRKTLSVPRSIDSEQSSRAREWITYDFNLPVVRYTTNGFWRGHSSIYQKLLRRLRRLFRPNVPIRNYSDYRRSFSIEKSERQALLEFFISKTDVFVKKAGL